MKLSIIIPAFNEAATIYTIIQRAIKANLIYPLSREIIVVNDGSTDDTAVVLQQCVREFADLHPLKIIHHEINAGKGACINTALKYAEGDLVLIQDADTEYDPSEYPLLLKPVIEGYADVVYGSRFMGGGMPIVCFSFGIV